MAKRTRSYLCKLRERFYEAFGKETSVQNTVLGRSGKFETLEERRKEALGYLVEKYFESKRREEEFRKKLESYGRVRRWMYERSMQLKDAGMIVREGVVKPFIITTIALSGFFSICLGTTVGPQITKFIETYFPFPFNYMLEVLIIFPIGFSPVILGIVLNYYVEKRKVKRMLENYGIEI